MNILQSLAISAFAMVCLASSAFADAGYVAYSGDGKHTATVLEKMDGKKVLVLDGKETSVSGIFESNYGYDTANRLYYVTKSDAGKFTFRLADTDIDTCDENPMTVDVNGKGIVALYCVKGEKVEITLYGKKYGPFLKDFTLAYPSWNAAMDAFAFEVSETEKESYYLLSNGASFGKKAGHKVGSLSFFGTDWKKVAYVLYDKNGATTEVRIGAKSYGTFDSVYGFVVSPDGSKAYYFAKKGEAVSLYANGKEIKKGMKEYGYLYFGMKKKLLMSYQTEKGWFFSIGNKVYGPFDESPSYATSDSDETVWVMIVKKAGKPVVLVNGKEVQP